MPRRIGLHIVHGLATAVMASLFAWFAVRGMELWLKALDFPPAWLEAERSFTPLMWINMVFLTPFAFLAWRPMGWGKLLLGGVGIFYISWSILVGWMTAMVPSMGAFPYWLPGAAGAGLVALAVTHQLIDPTFFRPASTPP